MGYVAWKERTFLNSDFAPELLFPLTKGAGLGCFGLSCAMAQRPQETLQQWGSGPGLWQLMKVMAFPKSQIWLDFMEEGEGDI